MYPLFVTFGESHIPYPMVLLLQNPNNPILAIKTLQKR